MKKWTMILLISLVACICAPQFNADSCDPDMSSVDKFTKQRTNRWVQRLYKTGSLTTALVTSSGVNISADIGQYGTMFAINVQLRREQISGARASFQSAYHAEKGDRFIFGLKGGEPLAFTATDVFNNSEVDMFGTINTTVVLSARVQEKDLAVLRNALTTKQIDAVRVSLTGDLTIEQSVNDSNGRKMMEKFSCFYQFLDKSGIVLSASGNPPSQPVQLKSGAGSPGGADPTPRRDYAAAGKYIFKKGNGTDGDYIELGADGKFTGQEMGKGYAGSYAIQGDIVTLSLPNGGAVTGKFIGNTVVEPDGTVLEKQAEPQKPTIAGPQSEPGHPASQEKQGEAQKAAGAQLTIDQVIQMVAAKLPDDIIITTIQNSRSKFDLTPDALIKLKTGGVSDEVIRAMTK